MRLSTIAAVVIATASTAALAQVARTPDAKEVPYANMAPSNAAMTNDMTSNAVMANEAMVNDTAPTPDTKTEGAAPRR